jgi:hypothetical protein
MPVKILGQYYQIPVSVLLATWHPLHYDNPVTVLYLNVIKVGLYPNQKDMYCTYPRGTISDDPNQEDMCIVQLCNACDNSVTTLTKRIYSHAYPLVTIR